MQGSDIQEEGNYLEEASNDYGSACGDCNICFCGMESCLKTRSRKKCEKSQRNNDEYHKRNEERIAKAYEKCRRRGVHRSDCHVAQ